MRIDCKMFPAKLDFPPATRDVGSLTGDEKLVRLTADVAGFGKLIDHPAMRALWCFGVDDKRLAVISRCESLEALYIEEARVRDLAPLAALRRLDVLCVDGATKVDSLAWLSRISPLSQLRLQHFPLVSTLAPVVAQPGIRALEVSGSMWARMKVDSFRPLSGLPGLRLLYLTNIAALDGSIQPLADLEQLRELHIAGFYEWQEFARLAGLRPDIVCSWFQPFVEFAHQKCDKCGGNLVMLTGKRQPSLCPSCHSDRIQRHVDRFMRVQREAAQ